MLNVIILIKAYPSYVTTGIDWTNWGITQADDDYLQTEIKIKRSTSD